MGLDNQGRPASASSSGRLAWARRASRLEREGLLLVFLSACDLFLTYILLWQGVRFYESNPLANWVFQRWNIAGMTAYKFGIIGVVIAICELVEHYRPGRGRFVLWFGILAVSAVVIHSLRLMRDHGIFPAG